MSTVLLYGYMVSEDNLLKNEDFREMIPLMKNDSYVLFLNKFAVDMTLNWLCNTEELPGVHEKSIFLTMDQEATSKMRLYYPHLKIVRLKVPALEDPFNYGDGPYQLFYLLRANVALTLAKSGKSFWMIQQDTFWRTGLPQKSLEIGELAEADIVFDAAGTNTSDLIAGGYYYTRSTPGTISYFEKLVLDLSWWYAPDNGYMTYLCYRKFANCVNMPFSWITNWQWMFYPTKEVPLLVQFDGYTKLGGKLESMKSMGFFFMDPVSKVCNKTAVLSAQEMVGQGIRPKLSIEIGHSQFATYSRLIEIFQSNPISSLILYNFLLPFGHYVMLTM
ncbi:unnamed protein product, partial [Mesorhabditis belari]|uniref:Nucleotide-diphospho-sugar transferase domain-containing protein n=1 Tax=Mesorhabditis belari TaxID=2138241 RepID=A0AAF3EGW9_9BILA